MAPSPATSVLHLPTATGHPDCSSYGFLALSCPLLQGLLVDRGVPLSAGLSRRRRPLEPTPGTGGRGETAEIRQGGAQFLLQTESRRLTEYGQLNQRNGAKKSGTVWNLLCCLTHENTTLPTTLVAAWGSGDRPEHLLSLDTLGSPWVFCDQGVKGSGMGKQDHL